MRDAALIVGLIVLARIAFTLASRNSAQRHARYRMRAKLARWLMDDQLSDARAKNGKLLVRGAKRKRTAKRPALLHVVRRDDQSA